ncbi:MAG TPA: disulfide bond formation protein B [Albitalea sp.]|uniref:disulfide bond formation protein B n=1 Tax=Piscinibacter sp. TaxID=1903157 RepID=UPI002ED0308F
MARPTSRRWLLAMAGLCLAAVGAALVSQHVFGMQPCPWCILQRLLFVVIALVCLLAAAIGARVVRRALAGIALLLAGCGIAAALWQNLVAAKSSSCSLTLADKVLNALGVEALAPWLFQVTGSCADAAVSLAGLPYEFWSLGLFVVLGAMSLRPLARG